MQSECVRFVNASLRSVRATELPLLARQEVRVLLNPYDNSIPIINSESVIIRVDQSPGIFCNPKRNNETTFDSRFLDISRFLDYRYIENVPAVFDFTRQLPWPVVPPKT